MLPHKKRILCIEDDEEVCSMISSLLSFIGYDVDITKTMAEALPKIRQEQFDLYIIDSWLPGGSGVEVCRFIRQYGLATPVIFYSAAAYDADKQQAMDAGANAYLVKPADIDKLVETIKRFCEE